MAALDQAAVVAMVTGSTWTGGIGGMQGGMRRHRWDAGGYEAGAGGAGVLEWGSGACGAGGCGKRERGCVEVSGGGSVSWQVDGGMVG